MWTQLLPFAALVLAAPRPQGGGGGGTAMLRFGCSQVVVERLVSIPAGTEQSHWDT